MASPQSANELLSCFHRNADLAINGMQLDGDCSTKNRLRRNARRVHFDTEVAVALIDVPVWVAHGGRDRLIPLAMGSRVFATAKRKGKMLIVPNAAHNDVTVLGGDAYWRWMEAALASVKREKESC